MALPVRNQHLASGERYIVSCLRVDPIEACGIAWAALLAWRADHPDSGLPVAVVATHQASHDNVWVARATEACRLATFRTRATVRPGSSPVLLFFPTRAVLDDYDTDAGTSALFVVESADHPLSAWRRRSRPRDLEPAG